MNVVGLISGGKDSLLNLIECQRQGHRLVCLAHLRPENPETVDEIDSHCFQTIGHQMVEYIAQAMEIPLIQWKIQGKSLAIGLEYQKTEGDEIEDLFALLNQVKQQHPTVNAISSGAIASNYQRIRIESMASRLGWTSLAFLWQRNQRQLLKQMIESEKMNIILIKVSCQGLYPYKHLGKPLQEIFPDLIALEDSSPLLGGGINIAGEGGEYESLTLDCPLYKSRMIIEESEIIGDLKTEIAPVAVLKIHRVRLEKKEEIPMATRENTASTTTVALPAAQPVQIPNCPFPTGLSLLPSRVNISGDLAFVSSSSPSSDCSTLSSAVHSVLLSLRSSLEIHGFTQSNIFFVQLYLRDLSDFQAANAAYVEIFPLVQSPSRVCVELSLPASCRVSADCWAHRGPREVLHVQSISRWAPACIGPYSQCSNVNGLLFLAGQIGLDPPTLKLIENSERQIAQCTASCRAILDYFHSSIDRGLVLIVYLSPAAQQSEDIRNQVTEHIKANFPPALAASVCYLVCPCLPRSALVEVQIVNFQRFLDKSYRPKFSCRQEDEGILAAVTSVPERFLNVFLMSSDRSFEAPLRCLARLLKANSLSMAFLTSARLFFVPQADLDNSFTESLTAAFASVLDCPQLPAISLLPVVDLQVGQIPSWPPAADRASPYILHCIFWDASE